MQKDLPKNTRGGDWSMWFVGSIVFSFILFVECFTGLLLLSVCETYVALNRERLQIFVCFHGASFAIYR